MNFAKQNRHEREELIPEDENVRNSSLLSGQRKHKVTLQNRPTFLGGRQSCVQPSFRRRLPGKENIK